MDWVYRFDARALKELKPKFKAVGRSRPEGGNLRVRHVDVDFREASLRIAKNVDHMTIGSRSDTSISCPPVTPTGGVFEMLKKNSLCFGTPELILRTKFHGIICGEPVATLHIGIAGRFTSYRKDSDEKHKRCEEGRALHPLEVLQIGERFQVELRRSKCSRFELLLGDDRLTHRKTHARDSGGEWCLKFPTSCGGAGHMLVTQHSTIPDMWPRPYILQEFIRMTDPRVYRTYIAGSSLFGWVTRKFPPGAKPAHGSRTHAAPSTNSKHRPRPKLPRPLQAHSLLSA